MRMFALAQSDVIPRIPLAEWTQNGVDWVTTNFEWLFDPLTEVIDGFVGVLNFILMSPPPLVMVGILTVLAFLLAGWRVALFTVLGLVFIIRSGAVGGGDDHPGARPRGDGGLPDHRAYPSG